MASRKIGTATQGKARGVPEVEGAAALGHVDNVLAVEGVVGYRSVDSLPDAQTLGVVDERSGGTGLAHLLQQPYQPALAVNKARVCSA